MRLHKFHEYKVSQLRRLLDDGQFAVPRLQRVFVWNGQKAAKLLDSVYRGMPIGALTVWDTSKKNRDLLRKDSKVLPEFREHNERVWFLLDGQQRLSVLYRVQFGGKVENARHQQVDFEHLVFRVTDGEGDENRFAYRRPVEREWVALSDVLAGNWRIRLRTLSQGQLNRAARCRESLLSYRVPLLRVETESLDDARELFVRINSAGTPISAADRAFARAAKFDLREHAEHLWSMLRADFRGLTHEALLQTLALLEGLDDVGASAMERVAARWEERIDQRGQDEIVRFTKVWRGQEQATLRAIDLLKSKFSVLDDGLLPSQYMVSTLSVFFVHRPKQPTPEQLAEIRKWFWATALGQRYSGTGYRHNIVDDAQFFAELAQGTRRRFQMGELIEASDLRRATYGRRSSIADAFYCLLISRRPQHLANGTDMQVSEFASIANRRHKHHVFPRQFLIREKGVSKRAMNSILNLCLIPADENSAFGSKPPRKYLEAYQKTRHFSRVMGRHLLPHEKTSGLWDLNSSKGYVRFLKERETLVCDAFEHAAGVPLFRHTVG
ncbi:DUF262 domain-containing protein [Caenimonas soli]|uniref:DUF262 domain-containing protein n=1 Tax=Caenimonas soli TaxID=2735555 RepID=UPI00155221F8|nr:DUF262 domain-containing protein [Caenimonas soli]NPC56665.1 DUF262 domain-containing protein [Caenimonas soli]